MQTWRRRIADAARLSVALWGANFLLFLLYSVIVSGRLSPIVVAVDLLIAISGLLISVVLFFAVHLSGGMRLPLRMGLLAIVALALGTLQAGSDTAIGEAVHQLLGLLRPLASRREYFANMIALYTEVYALYATSLALVEAAAAARRREVQLAAAETAAHQAQLAALRFQLNPHFLFNTLNAISSLILTDRNRAADEMLGKLSDFLRASLESDPEDAVALADELATLQTYLDVEAIRFGDRLAVDFVCPAHLADALVPGFLLQPLVENAVKYAVAPARRKVRVRIEAAEDGGDLILMVDDDGDVREQAGTRSGAGVGLKNVRRRLEVLYGDRGVLEAVPRETGFLAIVRLPLLRRADLARAA